MVPLEQCVYIYSSSSEPLIFDGEFAIGQGLFVDFAIILPESGVWTSTREVIERGVSHCMTSSKCKPKADDEVRRAMARARKFLADKGIDCAAPIRREDAARFMVEFAIREKEFSEEMGLARKVMQDNRDALRKLADS